MVKSGRLALLFVENVKEGKKKLSFQCVLSSNESSTWGANCISRSCSPRGGTSALSWEQALSMMGYYIKKLLK